MNHYMQKSALAGFKFSALTLVIATSFQSNMASATEVKELATASVSATTEDNYKIEQSTSLKYTQPILDTAKTITVISSAVMKDRNVDSLRDALRNVPGITLQAGEGGTPTGDSMTIRGFSSRNDIMIDGVRDVAGYTRDIYNIEAVEVAKGPGSAVYGRGSVGGTINLQTKTAKLDDFHDVSLRVGTADAYRAQLDSNIVLADNTALRINLLSDDDGVAGRDEVENSKLALAASVSVGIATDSRLTVNGDYQKQDNLPDYGLPWVPNYSGRDDRRLHEDIAGFEGQEPPVDYSNFYGNVNRDFEDVEAISLTVEYEKDISQNTMIRALARVGSIERQSIVSAPRFIYETIDDVRVYGEGARIDTGGEKTRDTEDSLAVVQLDLIGKYNIAGIDHDVVVGFEYAQEKFERWNFEDVVEDNLEDSSVDLYNPDSSLEFTGQYARTDKSNEATGDTTAVYIFDTITLNSHWQISAGLRYDIFDTEYFYDLEGDDPSVVLAATNKELSWNFGAVYKLAENGSIYFGAGNSFSPSAEDLTASTRGNNAELDPEETQSFEFGTKWELFDGRLLASAAIFRTEKTNARSDDPFAEDSRDDTLDGEQRVDGIELSAVGQINEQLSISVGYTYQDSEVLNATGDDAVQIGQALRNTPKHSFALWGKYDISDKLAVGLGSQYMGERYNSSDPGGRETAQDYLIFDMMISYQVTDKFALQFNGENLTGEDYADQIGGGHFVPGPGRYLSLSANYSF
ncbi:MAG: TonB-dependent siderophore receptor [Alteromonadaceae bacterium]|nr:TonB-dependent siderophore receptor [Alteromonadaceae bacterium]